MSGLGLLLVLVSLAIIFVVAVGTGLLVVGLLNHIEKNNEKEKVKEVNDIKFLRSYVGSPDGQRTIRDWGEALRERVGNRDAYLGLVLANNDLARAFDLHDFEVLFMAVEEYAAHMAPGHDIGHLRRDGLNAMILFQNVQGHPADKLAGLIAGWAHDVGNAVTPRYQDKVRNAGHTVVSAYLLDLAGKGLVPQGILDLANYAILAHGHVLKPMDTSFPDPFTVQPYWDEMWNQDGILVGLAIRMARWADRMDTCALTQGGRHVISRCDSREENSEDLADANTWVQVGGAGLKACFVPGLGVYEKVPVLLQHLRNYQNSYQAFGSPYASQDFVVPAFARFTTFKFAQLDLLVGAANDMNITPLDADQIKDVLAHISGAKAERFDQAWEVFMIEWESLEEEQRTALGRVYAVMAVEYQKLMAHYLQVLSGSDFSPLARKVVANLLAQ